MGIWGSKFKLETLVVTKPSSRNSQNNSQIIICWDRSRLDDFNRLLITMDSGLSGWPAKQHSHWVHWEQMAHLSFFAMHSTCVRIATYQIAAYTIASAATRVLTVVRRHDTCEKPADSSLSVENRSSKDWSSLSSLYPPEILWICDTRRPSRCYMLEGRRTKAGLLSRALIDNGRGAAFSLKCRLTNTLRKYVKTNSSTALRLALQATT